jgi:hypothetical protein
MMNTKKYIGIIGIILTLFVVIKPQIVLASIDEIEVSGSAQTDNPIKNEFNDFKKIRKEKIVRFLKSMNSPFIDEIDEIIEAAEGCGMKPELIIAISGVESTFGKQYPIWSNNPLGWGIYGDQILSFPSLGKAFEAASCGIAKKYPKDSQENIEGLGVIYNGVTPTSWSSKVRYFLKKIDSFNPTTETLMVTL